jgi:hypothetical protein
LLILPGALPGRSQEKLFEYQLTDKELVNTAAHIVYDSGNSLLLTIAYSGGAKKILLQPGGASQSFTQEKINRKDASCQINCLAGSDHENYYLTDLGGLIDGNTALECCRADAQQGYYFIETNLLTGVSHTTDTVYLGEDEQFVTEFKEGKSLYLISYFHKSNRVNFYRKEAGRSVDFYEKVIDIKKQFPLEEDQPQWIRRFSDFFKADEDDNYIVLDNARYNPPLSGYARQKIYHFPGKLIFTAEDDNLSTYFVRINLPDLVITTGRIAAPLLPLNGKKKNSGNSNSFIADSLLVKAGACNQSFFVSVTNIYTGRLLYNNVCQSTVADSSLASPLFEGMNFAAQKKHKGPGLFKSFYKERFSIVVNRLDGTRWSVDLYSKPYKTVSFAQVMLSIALSATLTYGINSIPNTAGYALFMLYNLTDAIHAGNVIDFSNYHFTGDTILSNQLKRDCEARNKALTGFLNKKQTRNCTVTLRSFGEYIYVSCLDIKRKLFTVWRF